MTLYDKPILVGGVGEINFGKQYRQGNRVYDSEAIAMCLNAQPVGNAGGNSYLYLVDENSEKGSDKLTQINDVIEGKPFKYVSLFSGIGGFEQALNKLGGTCVMASEIDKFANQAYEILYGHPTVGDVTKVKASAVPDHDLLVGGFPCQSFSVAGKRLGFDDTRGTLFFEIARIAKVKQPRAMLLENVKGLVGHDGGRTLDTIVQTLNDIGYTVDFEVLNSKYFGVPQNRERIFIVAIRDDLIEPQAWEIGKRTDVVAKGKRRIAQIDGVKTFNFDYPEQTEVTTRLRDILETDVDERYYLSEEKTAKLVAQLEAKNPNERMSRQAVETYNESELPKEHGDIIHAFRREHLKGGICPTLSTRPEGFKTAPLPIVNAEPQMVGHVDLKGHDAIRRVYSTAGVSPTLTTMGGGHREPKIAEMKEIASGDNLSYCIDANYTKGIAPGGIGKGRRTHIKEVRPVLTPDRVDKRQNGRRFKDDGEEAFTLTAQDKHGVAVSEKEDLIGEEKERDTAEILRALRREVGEETVSEWRFRVLNSFQSSEILQSKVYGECIHGKGTNGRSKLVHGTQTREDDTTSGYMREMWGERKCGSTSQGRELEEQFARELTGIMSKLSLEGTSTEKEMHNLRETTQGSRLLQQALYKIQEVWRSDVPKARYRIRKLSPLECFRLQGFSDEAHQALVDAGISNSQLYKQAGNAVTVNVIDAIGRRLLPFICD